MKCPKCDYISFDYNDTCPKCGNSLAAERTDMNLPDFKPAPPILLGALIKEGERQTLSDEPESLAPGMTPSTQKELMASLDPLTTGEKISQEPEAEALKFDIEPEFTDLEEIGLDKETVDTGSETLGYDMEPEEPGPVNFDVEPEAPTLDHSRFDLPPESTAIGMKEDEPQVKTGDKRSEEGDEGFLELEEIQPLEMEIESELPEDKNNP